MKLSKNKFNKTVKKNNKRWNLLCQYTNKLTNKQANQKPTQQLQTVTVSIVGWLTHQLKSSDFADGHGKWFSYSGKYFDPHNTELIIAMHPNTCALRHLP